MAFQDYTAAISEVIGKGLSAAASWFGPGVPVAPMAPEDAAWGRQYDYPQSTNLSTSPKANEVGRASYAQLRSMSTSCDILRLVIETAKDRATRRSFRVCDDGGDPKKPSVRAIKAQAMLRFPDGRMPFRQFWRALLEDKKVIDAATVWVDRRNATQPRLHFVDGATIMPIADETGRPVMIRQVLKGLPAHDYDMDTMIWAPSNLRPNAAYGYSQVEQIISTVSMALQRTSRQIEYFTKGNIPDLIMSAPLDWTPGQIAEANDLISKMLAGIAGKGQMKLFPAGKVELIKNDVVKNEFDEWLTRIICYCMSVSVTPFVKDNNRATAESTQTASREEGELQDLAWGEDLFDRILRAVYGPGLKFSWEDDSNPGSAIMLEMVKCGVIKPETMALRMGFEPSDVPDAPRLSAPSEDVAKGEVGSAEDDTIALIQEQLDAQKSAAIDAAKSAMLGGTAELANTVNISFVKSLAHLLELEAMVGATESKAKYSGAAEASSVKPYARDFARDRAAEMVGMKWDGNALVENPNVEWRITDKSRELVRDAVEAGFRDGKTGEKVAQEIAKDPAFSARRARNIARTEIASAQDFGNLTYLKEDGYDFKKWSDQDGCPICKGNAAQGGIPIESAFQSGHQHAPAHPSCRCRVLPAAKKGEK